MDYRLESEIWRGAQGSLTNDAFVELLSQAIRTYKRPPGYFPLDRLHAADVDEDGLKALSSAIGRTGNPTGIATDNYVSLRTPLRAHLYRVLQHYVISSIAGHIGRRAKNLVLRISTKPCFSWARMPFATARSAAPPPVVAVPTRADHGLKIFRNSQPNCRALSRYLLMMERISNRYRVYSVKAIAYAHFLQSGIPECPTHPLKLLNTAKPFCAR